MAIAWTQANGRHLTCCGDEPFESCEEGYARGSEWLLHEAFCLYSERDVSGPYEKHHSTVKDACELAERLGVRNLLLYHTEDRDLPERKRLYMEEGLRCHHGDLCVPDDLEAVVLLAMVRAAGGGRGEAHIAPGTASAYRLFPNIYGADHGRAHPPAPTVGAITGRHRSVAHSCASCEMGAPDGHGLLGCLRHDRRSAE